MASSDIKQDDGNTGLGFAPAGTSASCSSALGAVRGNAGTLHGGRPSPAVHSQGSPSVGASSSNTHSANQFTAGISPQGNAAFYHPAVMARQRGSVEVKGGLSDPAAGGPQSEAAVPNYSAKLTSGDGGSAGLERVLAPVGRQTSDSVLVDSTQGYHSAENRRTVVPEAQVEASSQVLKEIKEAPPVDGNSFAQLTNTFRWQSWNAKLGILFSPERLRMVNDILKGCCMMIPRAHKAHI